MSLNTFRGVMRPSCSDILLNIQVRVAVCLLLHGRALLCVPQSNRTFRFSVYPVYNFLSFSDNST